MDKLENKTIKFRCHKCGYYYEAKAKVCTLERQKINDEFEVSIFGRDCPNCRCLNRELDPDLKRRVYTYSKMEDKIDDH